MPLLPRLFGFARTARGSQMSELSPCPGDVCNHNPNSYGRALSGGMIHFPVLYLASGNISGQHEARVQNRMEQES